MCVESVVGVVVDVVVVVVLFVCVCVCVCECVEAELHALSRESKPSSLK